MYNGDELTDRVPEADNETYLASPGNGPGPSMVTTALSPAMAIHDAALGGVFFSIAAVLTLIVILAVREIGSVGVREGRRTLRLRFLLEALNAPILALVTVFAVVVIVRAFEVL